mmetsp:Transcript_147498/g.282724  ORF Transcript_147498/g.282724 Transcript_147498/m.282724 type:complete len:439 (-) Transcript_147498:89-1405(-)
MPSSSAAASLFSSSTESDWSASLKSYEDAIRSSSSLRSRPDSAQLESLDTWLRCKWPQEARKTGLCCSSLQKIARWKLARGEWRPLMGRIRGNSEAAVASAWTAAMKLRASGGSPVDVVSALAKDLDGVGPATASAILAPCFEDIPFMADEAMDGAGCPRKYDLKTYAMLAKALGEKAAELGPRWTAERVGRALWAYSELRRHTQTAASTGAMKRPAASEEALGESEPEKKRLATDSGVQAPKLFLVKFSEAVETTAKLAKKMTMSGLGWHGGGHSIVAEDCQISGLDDAIAEDLRSKAGEVQQHIEGIFLPGSERDFEGYAFVVDLGSETDLKTALSMAFGVKEEAKKHVTLETKAFEPDFAHDKPPEDDDDDDQEEGEGDAEQLERLRKATAILKAYGDTYEMNFTEAVICGPVLYFAHEKGSMLILGVIGGRVWT